MALKSFIATFISENKGLGFNSDSLRVEAIPCNISITPNPANNLLSIGVYNSCFKALVYSGIKCSISVSKLVA